MGKQLYDIHAVCDMLGLTSRTLRFWEEKGLIRSEKVMSGRRWYTDGQIEEIKKVLTLRALGLSVGKIRALHNNEIELHAAINERRAAVYAAIEKRQREICVLTDALALIESGGNIYAAAPCASAPGENQYREMAAKCAEAVVYHDEALLYSYFSEKMKAYMPLEAYRNMRRDWLLPLGSFVKFGELVTDECHANILFQYVEYEKLGLRIKFVFHGAKLSGLWVTYCEI